MGANAVARALWIKVTPVRTKADLKKARFEKANGANRAWIGRSGRRSTRAGIGVEVILIDERRARSYAEGSGLVAFGCVGVLEMLHQTATKSAELRTAAAISIQDKGAANDLRFHLPKNGAWNRVRGQTEAGRCHPVTRAAQQDQRVTEPRR
jgi:hypothetical protein